MPRPPSHVRVILRHGLEEDHRQNVQQCIELDALLDFPTALAHCKELRAQTVSHIAKRHRIVNGQKGVSGGAGPDKIK